MQVKTKTSYVTSYVIMKITIKLEKRGKRGRLKVIKVWEYKKKKLIYIVNGERILSFEK